VVVVFLLGNRDVDLCDFRQQHQLLALPGNAFGGNWIVLSSAFPFDSSLDCGKIFSSHFIGDSTLIGLLLSWGAIWDVGRESMPQFFYLLTQLRPDGRHSIFYWRCRCRSFLVGAIQYHRLYRLKVWSFIPWFGGSEAVVWTDAIQGIVLITGALACSGVIFGRFLEVLRVFTLGLWGRQIQSR